MCDLQRHQYLQKDSESAKHLKNHSNHSVTWNDLKSSYPQEMNKKDRLW